MPSEESYDVVVVGAGSGGLTAAKTAARFGARVLLVEKLSQLGGDCTWFGCVPSKALIRCARALHEARTGARFGVAGLDPRAVYCDWAAVKQHVRGSQDHIYKQDDSPEVLEGDGVEVRTGTRACFLDASRLELITEAESFKPLKQNITAQRVILCTGAGPVLPPITGLDKVPYLTYETIFDLPSLPASLVVVGGGPIGSELAQAFARLGSKVTLVGRLMPREDDDVRKVMQQVFKSEGITMIEGRAESVEANAGGGVMLMAGGQAVVADRLLVASGRRPKGLEALNLDRAGVEWSDEGITVDASLRTTARNIYAAGDCVGGLQFTHLAGYHGAVAAFNSVQAIGLPAPAPAAVPRCTFTHPEVATVGMSLKEAEVQRSCCSCRTGAPQVLFQNLNHVDRAVCEGETQGFLKIIVAASGQVLGATVVANAAGEIASELQLAVAAKLSIDQISNAMHPYPAMAFALQTMAAEVTYSKLEKHSLLNCLRRCFGPRLQGNERSIGLFSESSSED